MLKMMRLVFVWILVYSGWISAESALPNWGPPEVIANVKIQSGTGGYAIQGIAVGDFNNDGLQDYLFTQTDDGRTDKAYPPVILLNNRKGGFVEATKSIFKNAPPLLTHSTLGKQIVADFNGDGRQDVYFTDYGRHSPPPLGSNGYHNTLILSTGKSKLRNAPLPEGRRNVSHGASAGDIDNDGDLDIYVSAICCGEELPHLIINDGKGKFSADFGRLPTFHINDYFTSSRFVDVNSDGFIDLILGGISRDVRSRVLLNDGNGFFSEDSTLPKTKIGFGTLQVRPFYLNEDQFPDLLVGSSKTYSIAKLQAFINQGDGTFRDASSTFTKQVRRGGPYFYLVDIDGDGDIDIVSRGQFNTMILNDGKGHFTSQNFNFNPGIFSGDPWTLGLVDVDGDGGRDFIGHMCCHNEPVKQFAVMRQLGPPLPPSIPLNLNATQKRQGKVLITWEYAWGATSYEVFRSDTPDGQKQLIGETKKTYFQDLNATGTRFYHVRSKNSAGLSIFSKHVSGIAQ